jgi:hypothetical protein
MESNPQHKEIRRLSLTSSIVFLAEFGAYVLIIFLHDGGVPPLLDGPVGEVMLFVPLAVAVVSITRLVFLQLTAGARIPFVDGWLIQLSILSLYIGPFIVYGFLNLIDVLPVK